MLNKENILIIKKWNITELANVAYLESHSVSSFMVHAFHGSTFLQLGVGTKSAKLYKLTNEAKRVGLVVLESASVNAHKAEKSVEDQMNIPQPTEN